ncbi:nardilysin-like [Sinocyclocheilus grahami]|uniref:nardilysin-like n=1 Tax=Sinocyclocheilus grahami TaxID=75366 RepID=UPI0007ACE02B|nr:PREDICTED: nardilysin-like [Sinocyclocheilus grahami]
MKDIPLEYHDLWAGDFPLNPDLHLPAENRFIATDFTLRTSDCPDTDFPIRIIDSERGCLWFRKDNKFKIPKVYACFQLLTPCIQESPKNLVLFDLFVNIVAHNLAEPAYDADTAQLEYTLVPGDHGLVNHKLPLLLKLIVEHLADFSATPDVLRMFIEQLEKTYYIILIKPDRLGKDVRVQILEHHRWSVMQKYKAIMADLSVTDLMDFVNRFKAELFVEGLVQGNFTSAIEELKILKNELVVGFGEKEKETYGDDQSSLAPETQDTETKTSSYGDVSELIFLPASPVLAKATRITDVRAFTSSINNTPLP